MRSRNAGFTLVELMVGLMAMALLAALSWQGLDGMARTQSMTQARADRVLRLQVALGQWSADLDAVVQLQQLRAIDWNGRVLRITRRASGGAVDGMLVVGWARRMVDGQGTWVRWQSPPLTTRGEVEQAWQRADAWSLTPADEDRLREVAIGPLDNWQIFFFRENAWTHPLSSDAASGPSAAAGLPAAVNSGSGPTGVVPDGVRLEIELPASEPISGRLTRDWARPTVSAGRS